MITVNILGLLRLESGIRTLTLEADTIKQVYDALLIQSDAITKRKLDGCVVLINGDQGTKRSKLKDGDIVTLMSPIAGG